MIQSKRINSVIIIAVVFALIISAGFVVSGNLHTANGGIKTEAEYATKLFGTDIISIEIIAEEDDWQDMLDNATSEQYIMADVIVNGKKFQNIGIRPKGNSSLTQVAGSDSDRYSFRLQFDEYIKGQTCFGLESFVINNMLGDNTYMKEYVSYELMQEAGVDAPYFGYADIKVNGKSWGLYLAVELYNESYEQRVFGDTSGMLYNVKSMEMGARQQNSENTAENQFMPPAFGGNDEGQRISPPADTDESGFSDRLGGQGGFDGAFGGRSGSSGGSLEYIDDNTESYSAIFNNVVGKGTENDFMRVVQALKALSKGEELETYLDVDQILRYLAAHTIVVNLDSYSSSMAQNYYLYEREGKITILPWDYNLAWGGFQSGTASSVINFPIDTPLSGVEMSSRPLIEKLFANTEYLERYHSYLQQLIDSYFADGKFEEKINALEALLSDYVRSDATAFCTYEEFKTAVPVFINLGNLRAQSVQGQLDGTVPSATAEQNANPDKLVMAKDLQLSELGSMMGQRGMNSDFMERMGGQNAGLFPGGMNNEIDMELMSKAMDIIRQANGDITDEVKEALLSLGLTAEQIESFTVVAAGQFGNMGQNRENRMTPDNAGAAEQRGQDRNPFIPSDISAQTAMGKGTDYIFTGVLFLILLAALIFAARFKKSY